MKWMHPETQLTLQLQNDVWLQFGFSGVNIITYQGEPFTVSDFVPRGKVFNSFEDLPSLTQHQIQQEEQHRADTRLRWEEVRRQNTAFSCP